MDSMFKERRKDPRYLLTDEYTVLISLDGVNWSHVEPCNISMGGIKFRSEIVIDIQEQIGIRIINTSKEPFKSVEIMGIILRRNIEYDKIGYGISFEPLLDCETKDLRRVLRSIS